jgi:hypothetical protein
MVRTEAVSAARHSGVGEMNNTNTGGFAFPIVVGDQMTPGMTLRDYFAAKAMQEMIEYGPWSDEQDMGKVAECAYRQADAMLKAREQ